MNVDTERVIGEVRQHPALWDLSHSLYKDRDARQAAWMQIYESLYPDFKHMESTKEIEKNVQQRWKTARDAYMRCKNSLKNTVSGSGGGKKKVYVYFNEMRFLDKKHDVEVEDSINTGTQIAPVEIDTNSIDTPSTSNQDMSNLESQVNSVQPETSNSSQKTTDPNINKYPKNPQKKRKHSDLDDFDKEMMAMFRDNAKLLKNEDLTFFMSLLPLVEKFSLHQKLIFRAEILKKAMEIANIVNPYETNRPDTSHSYYSRNSDSTYTLQAMTGDVSQDSVNAYVTTSRSSETEKINRGYQTIPTYSDSTYTFQDISGAVSQDSVNVYVPTERSSETETKSRVYQYIHKRTQNEEN